MDNLKEIGEILSVTLHVLGCARSCTPNPQHWACLDDLGKAADKLARRSLEEFLCKLHTAQRELQEAQEKDRDLRGIGRTRNGVTQ